ncbi:hypothetical protein [Profundibacter sp.]
MSKVNPAKLFGFLMAVLAIMGGLALMKGALLIGKHEADTLHLLQIVFRLDAGQWPHLDFMTPIGALAFAPIVWIMGQGAGVGHAIIYAQIALAGVLVPAVWWVGISRMRGLVPYLFGAVVLVMALALAFGLAEPTISISMYYNRWAWAIAFVAIGLAILPSLGHQRPTIDGAIIGFCMAALVMLKMTYFVGFAPAIIVGLLMRKSYKTLGIALFAGALALALVTLFAGFGFWLAYLNDLLLVAGSNVRAQPGEGLRTLLLAPAYLGGTLAAVTGVLLLRQTDDRAGSVALLLLVPGFIYVQFQNFGNDAQWLAMLAILLFALRPNGQAVGRWGWNLRAALNVVALAALALAAPSMINLASSPYRHLGQNSAWYEPILPNPSQHSDLMVQTIRTSRVEARVVMEGAGLEHLVEGAMRDAEAVLLGETLARCELEMGLSGWINAIAQDLQKAGLSKGKKMFVADAFSSHWMFGDLEPVPHGAPWYYGGLPGIGAADYLLVPLCPAEPDIRKQVLEAIKARPDIKLTEIRRTELYILLDIDLEP